jgi:hypothetical protein
VHRGTRYPEDGEQQIVLHIRSDIGAGADILLSWVLPATSTTTAI